MPLNMRFLISWAMTGAAIALLVAVSSPTSQAQTAQMSNQSLESPTPMTLGAPPALHAVGSNAANRGQEVAATPGRTSPVSAGDAYRLGAGDRVNITVFGQPDFSGNFPVDGTGNVAFPAIGPVRASGLTAAELGQRIASKLDPHYVKNPRVSVEVLSYRPFYILGEVRAPGGYPYVSGMSVVIGVALAGGFTYRARENSFYLLRVGPGGKRERIEANQDTAVEPGDVIEVRERYF
jgi:protein involved in polysaccharide export with SLBB domain